MSTDPRPRLGIHFEGGTLVVREQRRLSPAIWADVLPTPFELDPRIDAHRAPAAAYRELVTACARTDTVEFEDKACEYERIEWDHRRRFSPREYQSEAVEAWKRAGGQGTVILPTGAGKTFVAELAIAEAGRSSLIVTPTLDLMQQWYSGLSRAFGVDVGLIGGGYHEIHDLTVTTYDSAYIHMERLGNRFGMLIFDEVHHLPGASYAFAAECSIAPYRLGLTATPERSDGLESRYPELVGPIIYQKAIKELAGLHLADYDVMHVEVDLDDDERQRYQRERELYLDFIRVNNIRLGGRNGWQNFLRATSRSKEGRRALLAYRQQRQIALGCKAKIHELAGILADHKDDRVLVFTNDNDSVYEISRRFLVPAITHQTGVKERKEILERFNDGTYPALVTSRVLNEGVDIPAANVAVVMSGTGSVREHVQRLGRILRQQEGKHALLYELVARGTNEEFVSDRRRTHDAYR